MTAKKTQPNAEPVATALTTKQVAAMAKTTPRSLRRYLRSVKNDGVYTRYRFDEGQAKRIATAFREWLKGEDEAEVVAEPVPAQA